MDQDREFMLSTHPRCDVYLEFLLDSVKPGCRGCDNLSGLAGSLAVSVLEACAKIDAEGASISEIDSQIEEERLLEAQEELIEINSKCNGPTVQDHDPTDSIAMLERIAEDRGAEVNQELLSRVMLPLRAVCGLKDT